MAHEPRTRQLFAGALPSAGLNVLGTVPPGERWLVKYASIVSFATAPGSVGVLLLVGSDFSFLLSQADAVQFQLYERVELYGVLEEGQDLVGFADSITGGDVYLHVGGLVFDLP